MKKNQAWHGITIIIGTKYVQTNQNLREYGLLQADHTTSNFLKVVVHKFYLVRSRILCPI